MPVETQESTGLFDDIAPDKPSDVSGLFADIPDDVHFTPLGGDVQLLAPPPPGREKTPEEETSAFKAFQAAQEKRAGLMREQFQLEKDIAAAEEPSLPAKVVGKGLELASTGLQEILPNDPNLQAAIQRFVALSSPTTPAAIARERAEAGEPLPDIVDPRSKKAIAVATGIYGSLADTVNFFTSPLGIATLGMGALPKGLHAGISMAFAIQMAREVPEIARELGDELGKPENERDYNKIAKLTTSGITATGFSALGAAGAGRQVTKMPAVDVLQGEALADAAARRWSAVAAQDLASRPMRGLIQESRIDLQAPPPGEAFKIEGEGLLPSPRDFAQVIPPRAPLGPPAPTDRPTATQYQLYHANFFDMVNRLRKEGRPDMTRAQVREMFPNIFEGMPKANERAGLLAKQAWGDRWTPTPEAELPEAILEPKREAAPTTPPPPPEQPLHPGAVAVDEFNKRGVPIRWDQEVQLKEGGPKRWQYTINVPDLLRGEAPTEATFSVSENTAPNFILQEAWRKANEFLPSAADIFKASDEQVRNYLSSKWVNPEEITSRLAAEMTEEQLKQAEPIVAKYLQENADVMGKVERGEISVEEGMKQALDAKRKGKIFQDVFTRLQRKPAAAPVPPPEAQGALDPRKFPIKYAKANELSVQPDLMQFKRRLTGDVAGVTEEHLKNIKGDWDEAKAGLILVWEPVDKAKYGLTGDQKYIIANGHGRFNYGLKQGAENFNIQILREADGYSATDAYMKGAMINIAEGKGTLYDQALFLRELSKSHGEGKAVVEAKREGVEGKDAAAVAFSASDNTFDAFRNGILSDAQAVAISRAAPKNEAAQAVGRGFAKRIKDPADLADLVKRALEEPVATGGTPDLFGFDDSSMRTMEKHHARAQELIAEIRDDINSMRSAKRAEKAKKYGIDISDPDAILREIDRLNAEIDRLKVWWRYDDLYEKVTGTKKTPTAAPPAPAPPAAPPQPPVPPSEPPPVPPEEPKAPPTPGEPTAAPPSAPPGEPPPPKPTKPIYFDDKKAKKADDFLQDFLKKKAQQPPGGPPPAPPAPEKPGIQEIQYAAEEGELFPGEQPTAENPLFVEPVLRALTDVGGSLIEQGHIIYPEWFREMHARYPDLKHYFRRAYNQVRDVPNLHELAKGMTPREEVELYNDFGIKIGKGSKHRPGLRVITEELIPTVPQVLEPGMFVGPKGDSIDWTQALAINLALEAHRLGRKGVMLADGPGVGKSGMGAMIAHMLTKPTRLPLYEPTAVKWNAATDQERAKWLGTPGIKSIDKSLTFDKLTPEERQQVYENIGWTPEQIKTDNVNAGQPANRKVLLVGTSKEHLKTSFRPDFDKFGIPQDNIDFITYNLLSNPGKEGTPGNELFKRIIATDYEAVVFDEAHAFKNAGSSREHNSRKLKTNFKVFMTATPMDNRNNAIYFMSEITGKTRDQIMDQLGLQKITRIVNGEPREFVVQKEGIADADVKAALFKLRSQAIRDGLMIRREFPWWGDVVGKVGPVALPRAAELRWRFASTAQRQAWVEPLPQELRYPGGGDMPEGPEGFQYSVPRPEDLTGEDVLRVPKIDVEWGRLDDLAQKRAMIRMFTDEEHAAGYVEMAEPGYYNLKRLEGADADTQQFIFDNWEKLIEKTRNRMLRMRFRGLQTNELNRWLESTKADQVMEMITAELQAGRNVVVYGNTHNVTNIKGLNPDLPNSKNIKEFKGKDVQGLLGGIAKQLTAQRIPFAKIYGTGDKSGAISDFYGNRKRVALVTPEAGAAGLNLDDVIGRYPRTLIVAGIPWKGDAFEQLMYRVSRRNTASESKAHILVIPNGIADQKLKSKMDQKLKTLRGIQAGEDTDLQSFLDDLNNPEKEDRMGPEEDDIEMDGPIPKLEWREEKMPSGRLRYRAKATPEFEDWWDANGGKKNPMGWKIQMHDWQKWVIADQLPDESLYREPPEPPEDIQALGGHFDDLPDADRPLGAINNEIQFREDMERQGNAPANNGERLGSLRREKARIEEMDERAEAILANDPEYVRLQGMLDDNPGHPLWEQWEALQDAIVQDVMHQVKRTVPEPQQATASTATIPGPVAPAALRAPTRSIDEIQRILQRGLGTKIFYDSEHGGGFFDPTHQYIRIKKVGDFPGITHEGGHKLDDVFKFRDKPNLAAELDFLGENDSTRPGSRSSYKPGKSKSYKLGEGVAEFVRYWVTEPQYAAQHAPNMLAHWESILNANPELSFMRTVRNDYQTFIASDKELRLQSRIITEGDPARQPFRIGKIVEGLIDDLHFIRLASDDAFKAFGKLDASRDPYLLFRLLRGTFGRAEVFLRSGVIDGRTGDYKPGTSLMHALDPVTGHVQEFRNWITAKRAEELYRRGLESGIPREEWREVLMRHGSKPEFQEAYKRLKAYQHAVLQYTVDLGYKTADEVKLMEKLNEAYVPFHRLYEVGINEPLAIGTGPGGKLSVIGTPGSLRYFKGSERPIFDPIASIIENTYSIIFAAEKNRALTALADLSALPNMGKWVIPDKRHVEPVRFDISRIRQQLVSLGIDAATIPDHALLMFWRDSRRNPLPDNTIRVKRGNQLEYYKLDPDLYRAVNASDQFTLRGIWRVISYPSQLLRAGVTEDPAFVYRNILRDTVSAGIISRYGTVPFEAAIRGAYAILAPRIAETLGFKNHAAMLRAVFEEWKAAGGKHAVETAYFDRPKMQRFLRDQITRDYTYAQRGLFWARSPLMALRMLTQTGEEMTRVGEYWKVFNKELKSGASRMDAHLRAAFEARDLQDFAMQGSITKPLKLLTAFWNASMQGRYRFYRSFVDPRRPDAWKSTFLKGFGFITMAKLVEQYVNWDNEDYWSQPRWQRMIAFHIPIGEDKLGYTKFILLPVPFESGFIFATIPGLLLEYAKVRDVSVAQAFGSQFMSQMVDNPVPQPVMAVLESAANYDFFQQKPIVPQALSRQPYWSRYTDQTSLVAKKLGRMFPGEGVSPAKIEHFVRSTTGGIGTQIMHQGIDPLIGAFTGEPGSAAPVLPWRSLRSAPGGSRSQILDDFYKKLQVIQHEDYSRKHLKEKNPNIDTGPILEMTLAEREIADLRRQLHGQTDPDRRENLTIRMEKIARKFVRTPAGKYKGWFLKRFVPENNATKELTIPAL